MTCKDCKRRFCCADKNKQYEYDDDGDSWANWCDDFVSKHKSRSVTENGISVVQLGYNWSIYVIDEKTGKTFLHALCTEKKRKKELRKYIEYAKNLQNGDMFERIFNDDIGEGV